MQRLLRSLGMGKWRHYRGSDLEGNLYFEHPDPNQPHYMRRRVEPPGIGSRGPSHYVSSAIPPLWSAWLRRTRAEAPTIEELQQDAQRRITLADNVQKLNEAYKEEKARLAASTQPTQRPAIGPHSSLPREPEDVKGAESELQRARKHMQRSPLEDYRPAADRDEPEAWKPAIAKRR